MNEFDLPVLYRDDDLAGFDQYLDIKDISVGLMNTPGTRFLDSTYDLDFVARHETEAEFGPYTHLRSEVRVALGLHAETNHEYMLIKLDQFATGSLQRARLLKRTLAMSVFDSEVKHGHVITVLPRASSTPERAQPIRDVPLAHREDFDLWEDQLRQQQKMTRGIAKDVLAELRAFADEY